MGEACCCGLGGEESQPLRLVAEDLTVVKPHACTKRAGNTCCEREVYGMRHELVWDGMPMVHCHTAHCGAASCLVSREPGASIAALQNKKLTSDTMRVNPPHRQRPAQWALLLRATPIPPGGKSSACGRPRRQDVMVSSIFSPLAIELPILHTCASWCNTTDQVIKISKPRLQG